MAIKYFIPYTTPPTLEWLKLKPIILCVGEVM